MERKLNSIVSLEETKDTIALKMNDKILNPYGWRRIGWAYDVKEKAAMSDKHQRLIAALLFYRAMYRRVKTIGKTLIIQIDGEHQTGKSSSGGFLLCWLLDETFKRDYSWRVCTSAREILEAVKKIKEWGIIGAALMIDEGGAAAGRQDYHERIQKALNKTVQIIGNLHVIIVIISPIKQQVSSSLEKMSHKYMHFRRGSVEYTYLYPYGLHYNSISQTTYTPKPTVIIGGSRFVLKRIKIWKLPKWLDDKYREIENKAKPILLEKLHAEGIEEEIEEMKRSRNPQDLIPLVLRDYEMFLTKTHRRTKIRGRYLKLDANMIAKGLHITFRDAEYILPDCEEALNTPEKIAERKKNDPPEEKE